MRMDQAGVVDDLPFHLQYTMNQHIGTLDDRGILRRTWVCKILGIEAYVLGNLLHVPLYELHSHLQRNEAENPTTPHVHN